MASPVSSSSASLTSEDVAVLHLLQGADRVVLTAFSDQPDRPVLSLMRAQCREGESVQGVRTLTPSEYASFQHLLEAGLLAEVEEPRFAQDGAFLLAFQNEAVETRETEFALTASPPGPPESLN